MFFDKYKPSPPINKPKKNKQKERTKPRKLQHHDWPSGFFLQEFSPKKLRRLQHLWHLLGGGNLSSRWSGGLFSKKTGWSQVEERISGFLSHQLMPLFLTLKRGFLSHQQFFGGPKTKEIQSDCWWLRNPAPLGMYNNRLCIDWCGILVHQ